MSAGRIEISGSSRPGCEAKADDRHGRLVGNASVMANPRSHPEPSGDGRAACNEKRPPPTHPSGTRKVDRVRLPADAMCGATKTRRENFDDH